MDIVWNIFSEELSDVVTEKKLIIHSFVLMNNHFHMIVSTPQSNISQCMHQLMYRTSRRLTKAGNRINGTFAGRHYKCILQEHNYFLNAYKYNYRNPVTAGVCKFAEEYKYSTLRDLATGSQGKIPICADLTFESDPAGTINWINTSPDSRKLEGVRFGLKHQFFKAKKCISDNRPLIYPSDIL